MNLVGPLDAKEVMRRLESQGYRPVLVGGLAVEVASFGGTTDVDVLVPEAEYGGAEFLRGSGLTSYSNTGNFTNGRLTLENGRVVPFDVLNPALFVGKGHSGEEFFRYVRRFGSSVTPFGRVATPAVVYYTRLLVSGPHRRTYELRIRRDLDEGAPVHWLDGAVNIAHRFGTERKIRPKVARIRKERSGLS
jgi:hypothetical protein